MYRRKYPEVIYFIETLYILTFSEHIVYLMVSPIKDSLKLALIH